MNEISTVEAYEIIFKDFPDVVGVEQVSKMLGICNKKVYRLIKDGEIPIIPCCRSYKMAKLHIIEYMLGKSE